MIFKQDLSGLKQLRLPAFLWLEVYAVEKINIENQRFNIFMYLC